MTGSAIQMPSVATKRLHLTPDEANRLIEAAGKRGRYPFRDRVLLRAIYRHGLRLSAATGMLWDQLDLDGAGTMLVKRLKRGETSTHTMDRDELRDLRKLHKARTGPYVFETERGGALADSTVQRIVDEANGIAKLPMQRSTRTRSDTLPATAWWTRERTFVSCRPSSGTARPK